jgi:predicted aspartyl protease
MNIRKAQMRKTALFTLCISLLLNSAILAQVEDLPEKGVIPFELREHLIVIKGKVNDSSRMYNFILDTGGLTFIDRKVAEELGLKIRGNMAKMDILEMGEVSISNIFAFMGFNFQEFEKHGIPLCGIIGSNLLERFMVTLDYRNQRVILSPSRDVSKENAHGFKFKFTNHRINYAPMIDCTINGTLTVKMMVDTGQPYSVVLPLDYLDKMCMRDDPSLVRSKGLMIKWPGTKTTDVYLGRIKQFAQGVFKIDDLMCCFAELPHMLSVPLLGKDYLCQFLITIDYPNDEILFTPYKDAQFVKDMFSFGMNLSKADNNVVIVDGLWTGGPADHAGIKVAEEIVACNGTHFKGDDIYELRQLLDDEDLKEAKLAVRNRDGQREVVLCKEMILRRKDR